MDFQVSSPSNHFFIFCYCLERYSVQLQQCDGRTVNWLNSLGKGRHRCRGLSPGVAGGLLGLYLLYRETRDHAEELRLCGCRSPP